MATVYVGRKAGAIVHVSQLPKEHTPEPIDTEHPDFLTFLATRDAKRTPEQRMRNEIVNDPFRKALVKLLAADRGVTNAEMVQLLVDQLQ